MIKSYNLFFLYLIINYIIHNSDENNGNVSDNVMSLCVLS